MQNGGEAVGPRDAALIAITKVSDGCKHCYAETMSGRNPGTLGKWGPSGTRVVAAESYWKLPVKWNRAAQTGERRRVFCASLADVFEDWQGPMVDTKRRKLFTINGSKWFTEAEYPECRTLTMKDVRSWLFALIDATPNLDWLLLTKRPENVRRMWPDVTVQSQQQADDRNERGEVFRRNVWLLTSVEDQVSAVTRISELLKCRDLCPVLGVSAEPLLGPVDLTSVGDSFHAIHRPGTREQIALLPKYPSIDWVIAGGESGPKARPCCTDWIRSIVGQCKSAGVPCFVKQLGAKPYMEGSGGERFQWPCGFTVTGGNTWLEHRDRKGGDPSEWPADLCVREFPCPT